jgi:predicted component of type VI protein secretion system
MSALKAKLILAIFLMTVAAGCASHRPNKKLKPGKPIPCPQKDC